MLNFFEAMCYIKNTMTRAPIFQKNFASFVCIEEKPTIPKKTEKIQNF